MYRKGVVGQNEYSPCLHLAGPGLQRSCMMDQQLTQMVNMDVYKQFVELSYGHVIMEMKRAPSSRA
jgi:hypothetical protein